MYYDERENHLNIDKDTNYIKFDDVNKTTKNEFEFENEENNYKFYGNKIFNIENANINNFRHSVELMSVKDGFNKGNMFSDEYIQYKKHIYKVVVKDERDKLLLEVQELTFAFKDLNLYLDVYPNDSVAFEKFKDVNEELLKKKQEYEKKYGPLFLESSYLYPTYEWVKNPWPWMNEGRGD